MTDREIPLPPAGLAKPSRDEPRAVASQKADFLFLLSQAIESVRHDPARQRRVVYELVRAKLQREAWLRNPPVTILEMRQYLQAFDAAIAQIESGLSQEDELQSLLFRMKRIEESKAASSSPRAILPPQATTNLEPHAAPSPMSAAILPIREAEVAHVRQARKLGFGVGSLISMLATALIAAALVELQQQYFHLGGGRDGVDPRPFASEPDPKDPQARAIATQTAAVQSEPQAHAAPSMAAVPQPAALPLPSLYGVYAVDGGHLEELEPLPIRVPFPKALITTPITTPSRTTLSGSGLSFIAFRRDLTTDAPERITIRAIAKVSRSRTYSSAGKATITNLDDLWAFRSDAYDLRVAPLGQSPEMIAIRPETSDFALPAGRYALILKGQAYDFSIAGPVSSAEQCLEKVEALNNTFYSECKDP